MCLDVIGFEGQGFGDQINGNVVLPRLMRDHTQQMQSDGLIGITLQYLLIHAFRLRQATSFVMLYGKVYGLLDG